MDMKYSEEIEFLKKVEEKIPMNQNREKLTDAEIQEIRNKYPNIPEDYLDYLKEIGWGSFRECQFMIFGKPDKLSEIIGEVEEIDETDLIFFGDNFAGDFSGFNLKKDEKVIEWWHDSNEINETEQTFKEYIRKMMLMDEKNSEVHR
jgi:hypothetical protein